jgi:hypothetical protein
MEPVDDDRAMRSVEIFFNFMVVGANRNVLWRDPARVSKKRRELSDPRLKARDSGSTEVD